MLESKFLWKSKHLDFLLLYQHSFSNDPDIASDSCHDHSQLNFLMFVSNWKHFLLLCPSFDTQRDLLAGVLALVRPFGLSIPSNEVLTQLLM